MKCLSFHGRWYEAQNAYNKWAEGKPLTKDVIIHSHAVVNTSNDQIDIGLLITVFFDEQLHPAWVGK